MEELNGNALPKEFDVSMRRQKKSERARCTSWIERSDREIVGGPGLFALVTVLKLLSSRWLLLLVVAFHLDLRLWH